jgi:pre-mRNA-splicing factor ATP-dependent RNA helicase DHX15/PRP43
MTEVLDIKGKKDNFLTNQPYSDEYKRLAKIWSKLPMYSDKKSVKKFFDYLDNKQIILLSSGTGSGKTVIVPKFLLKYVIKNNISGKIAVTNPKVLITISNAEYSAKTLDVKLGDEVGFKYKGNKKLSSKTKLIYLTDGLLQANILGSDKLLSEYACVIIDEAHERHIQIDVLLKLLKEIVLVRKDFKVIIMSATLDAQVFRDYFKILKNKFGEITVSGSSNYPIKQIWEDNINLNNILQTAVDKCHSIIKTTNTDNNDIIVFVPTKKETINGCNKIISNKKLFCVEVFSGMNDDNKALAISKDNYKKLGYTTKVIFATNVAESSITFDGLKYVIDTGLELVNEYDSHYNMNIIKKDYTSQAQIIQRIGRAGRTAPGIAYHLYSKKKFESLHKHPKPNILVIDLTEYALQLIYYTTTFSKFIKFTEDLITPPTQDQMNHLKHKLQFTKCLKTKNNDLVLTKIGKNVLKFKSISLLSALAIIMSYYLYCQEEIIIIMAIMEITEGKLDTLFIYDKLDEKKLTKYFSEFCYPNSDHLTVLRIYLDLYKNNNMTYLNQKMFKKIDLQIKDIKHYIRSITDTSYKQMNVKYKLITISPYNDIYDNIMYVLGKSYLFNLIKNNMTVNFLHNSKAKFEYSKSVTVNKNKYDYAICYNLTNKFGKKVFVGVTEIPNHIKFL